MLCLRRKVGERIVLDGGVEILIYEIGRGHVRIGVTAPKETRITRGELIDKSNETEGQQ